MQLTKRELLLLLLLTASPVLAQDGAGSVAPEHPDAPGPAVRAEAPEIGSSGAFAHVLPLELPAGRRDMAPAVSLAYDSHGRAGILGVGWKIAGFPAIVRINTGRGISFTGADSFALTASWFDEPGVDQRLVGIGGNNYHLAKDTRQRFTPVGVCGTGQPCAWTMRDGTGRTYHFGRAAQMQHLPEGGAIPSSERGGDPYTVAAWGLTRVVDEFGNAYEIEYLDQPGHLYPRQVVWTLPSIAGAAGLHQLYIDYEQTQESLATPAFAAKRVRSFRVLTAEREVRRWDLAYQTSPASGRSLLRAVQEIGEGTLLGPRHDLTYTEPSEGPVLREAVSVRGFASGTEIRSSYAPDLTDARWTSLVGDVNGDGRDDIVRLFGGTLNQFLPTTSCGAPFNHRIPQRTFVQLRLGRPTGSDPVLADAILADAPNFVCMGPLDRADGAELADINGDGRADLVQYSYGSADIGFQYWLGGAQGFDDVIEGPRFSWAHANPESPVPPNTLRVVRGDFNGDQLPDFALLFLKFGGRKIVTFYGHPDRGLTEPTELPWTHLNAITNEKYRGVSVGDVDGDGTDEIVVLYSTASGAPQTQVRVAVGWGSASGTSVVTEARYGASTNVDAPTPRATGAPGQDLVLADFDGDGRDEIFVAATGSHAGKVKYWTMLRGRSRTSPGTLETRALRTAPKSEYGFNDDGLDPDDNMSRYAHLGVDLDGDERADFAALYVGERGVDLHWAYQAAANGTWANATSPEGAMRVTETTPAGDGPQWSDQWHYAAGDANGDGLAEIFAWRWIEISSGETWLGLRGWVGSADQDRRAPHLAWIDGARAGGRDPRYGTTTSALCKESPCGMTQPPRRDRNIGLYNKDHVHVEAGDFDGDGRSDLAWIDDSIIEPSDAVFPIRVWMSQAGPKPDLLRVIKNGRGGTITIGYASSADYPQAHRPGPTEAARLIGGGTAPMPRCGGVDWSMEPAVRASEVGRIRLDRCGASQMSPTTVVSSITHDNGRGTTHSWTFDYENARVRLGDALARRPLGFEVVRRYSDDAFTEVESRYNQTLDVAGNLLARNDHDHFRGVLRTERQYTYAVLTPYAGATDVQFVDRAAVLTREYDDDNRLERIIQERVVGRDTLQFPTATETCVERNGRSECVQQLTSYVGHDLAQYWIGRAFVTWTVTGLGQGLDAHRYSYWPNTASLVRQHERLLFQDLSLWFCAPPTEAAGLCASEIQAGLGRWVSVETWRDRTGGVERPGYDTHGLPTHLEDAAGATSVAGYDTVFGAHVATMTNAAQHRITHHYDWAGRRRETIDANNQVTTFEYDGLGRLAKMMRPLPGVSAANPSERREYLDEGLPSQRVKVTQRVSVGDDAWTMNWIDGFGDIYATETSSAGGASLVQAIEKKLLGGHLEITTHRHALRKDPAAAPEPSTGYALDRYDNTSRLWQQWDVPFGNPQRYLHAVFGSFETEYRDAAGRSVWKTYDLHRRIASVRDTANETARFFYDAAGNLTTVHRPGLGIVSMTYDSFGRVTSQTQPETGSTTYEYDDLGQPTRTLYSNGRVETVGYDEIGRPTAVVRDGQITTFEYDAARSGRLVSNAVGRLVEASYPLGTTTQLGTYKVLAYDSVGRVLREEHSVAGTSGEHAYSYDDLGRVTRKTLPDGSEQVDEYGPHGGAIRRIRAVIGSQHVVIADYVDYDSTGRILSERRAGLRGRFTYEQHGRLRTAVVESPASGVLQSYRYGYDAVGNVERIEDLRPNASRVINGVDTSEDQSLTYDAQSRLRTSTTLAAGGATHAFTYDSGGNITMKDGVTRTYGMCAVGSSEQCIIGTLAGAEHWRARHDRAGLRTALEHKAAGTRWDYEYDAGGRLTWARKRGLTGGPVIQSAAIAYDHLGGRARKIFTSPAATTVTTTWLSHDYELRTSSRGPGSSRTRHFHSPDGKRLASYTDGAPIPGQRTVASLLPLANSGWQGDLTEAIPAGWTFAFANHLGSTTMITDERGAVISRTVYAPYGEIVSARSRGSAAVTTKYAGLELDDETGLHFANARYYDTVTARFLTADTFTPGLGQDSQGWNRYAYSRNSPINYVDPSGHLYEPKSWISSFVWQGADTMVRRGKVLVDVLVGAGNGAAGTDTGPTFGNDRAYGGGMVLGGTVGLLADVAVGTAGTGGVAAGGALAVVGEGPAAVVGAGLAAAGAAVASGAGLVAAVHANAIGRGLDHVQNGGTKLMEGKDPTGGSGERWNPGSAAESKVPAEWGPSDANRKGDGVRWSDPEDAGNRIRIDRGNPDNSQPLQQVDHVLVHKRGVILGPDGKPITGSLKDNPQAHIRLTDWLKWKSWDQP